MPSTAPRVLTVMIPTLRLVRQCFGTQTQMGMATQVERQPLLAIDHTVINPPMSWRKQAGTAMIQMIRPIQMLRKPATARITTVTLIKKSMKGVVREGLSC